MIPPVTAVATTKRLKKYQILLIVIFCLLMAFIITPNSILKKGYRYIQKNTAYITGSPTIVTYYQWLDPLGEMRISLKQPLTTEEYISFQGSIDLQQTDYYLDPDLIAKKSQYLELQHSEISNHRFDKETHELSSESVGEIRNQSTTNCAYVKRRIDEINYRLRTERLLTGEVEDLKADLMRLKRTKDCY